MKTFMSQIIISFKFKGMLGKDVGKMGCSAITQTDQRIGYIDALKGFAILCVVLGHVANGYIGVGAYPAASGLLYNIYNLIYAFHMPLFMMLSGYLYYTAYFNNNGKPDSRRIHRQVNNQIGVYVIFNVAVGLPKALVSSFTSNALVTEITLLDIALIWIKPLGIYWYLYVLIFFYLIFSIDRLTEVNRWVLLGIFTATAICGQVTSIPWFALSRVLYKALFFFIGIAGKKYKDWIIGNKWLTLVLFVISIGASAMVCNKKLDTSRYANDIFILSIVVALGISLMLWYVFDHINFIGNNRLLKMCGRYSLEIYVIHSAISTGLRTVFLKVGVHNVYISIALNLFISTMVPILFSMLCKKLNIHGLFFKPVTYVTKKIRK